MNMQQQQQKKKILYKNFAFIPSRLLFSKAAVALHYGICSLCVISPSYRQAINNKNKNYIKQSCGPDIIVQQAGCGPWALSLTHML